MRTFHEKFKDCIDMYHGTAIVTEPIYRSIQKDALQHALNLITNNGEYGMTTTEMASALQKEINCL